jgi:hypothetical protein
MNEYVCKVYWEMCGEVRVKANSQREAHKLAEGASVPMVADYVSESFNCDISDVIEVGYL